MTALSTISTEVVPEALRLGEGIVSLDGVSVAEASKVNRTGKGGQPPSVLISIIRTLALF